MNPVLDTWLDQVRITSFPTSMADYEMASVYGALPTEVPKKERERFI